MTRESPRPKKAGIVHLVGAGPGDPMLLTRKAHQLLKGADVVAYDDLVHPSLLALVRPGAELIAVGYRGLRDKAMTQAVLAPEVIAAAQAGKMVVRLKTGDPLVLGRGGEEALILTELGIPFTIVPGITAALGAAASAGIPLTHRNLAGGFRLMTGHRLHEGAGSSYEGGVSDDTLVVYMVRKHLASLAQELIQKGWNPATPAAFVINATTSSQKVLTGTLAALPDLVHGFDDSGPGLALIGPTVSLRRELGMDQPPALLGGQRILLARARPGPSQVAHALRERGADVIEAPYLVPRPLSDASVLADALHRLGDWDVWAFGCPDSVKMFFQRLRALGLDTRDLPRRPVMAVGAGVEKALRRYGWRADLSLAGACAHALQGVSQDLRGRTVILFSHTGGRPQLMKELGAVGASVSFVGTYDLCAQWTRIVAPIPRLIVIPSSSAAHYVFAGDLGFDPREIPVVAIGPASAKAAAALGAKEIHIARQDQTADLVDLAVEVLTRQEAERQRAPTFQAMKTPHKRQSVPRVFAQEIP